MLPSNHLSFRLFFCKADFLSAFEIGCNWPNRREYALSEKLPVSVVTFFNPNYIEQLEEERGFQGLIAARDH